MLFVPQLFWDWALNGQPHTIDIAQWQFKNLPLLRTTLYQRAEALNRRLKTHKVAPTVLAFVAWEGTKLDFPGLMLEEATTVHTLAELPGYVPPRILAPRPSQQVPTAMELLGQYHARQLSDPAPGPTLEDLVAPCSCGLGLDVHVGHPPTCAVWG